MRVSISSFAILIKNPICFQDDIIIPGIMQKVIKPQNKAPFSAFSRNVLFLQGYKLNYKSSLFCDTFYFAYQDDSLHSIHFATLTVRNDIKKQLTAFFPILLDLTSEINMPFG